MPDSMGTNDVETTIMSNSWDTCFIIDMLLCAVFKFYYFFHIFMLSLLTHVFLTKLRSCTSNRRDTRLRTQHTLINLSILAQLPFQSLILPSFPLEDRIVPKIFHSTRHTYFLFILSILPLFQQINYMGIKIHTSA